MDFLVIVPLAALFAALTVAILRSVITRRRRILLLLPLPVTFFAWRWAAYRRAWSELGVSLVLAGLCVAVWWVALGRRLPPPTDDDIRVWTKDNPF